MVIPSLPGYGFSTPLGPAGFNLFSTASMWAQLMSHLGYERFAAQGTDAGSGVAGMLPMVAPGRVIGIHLTGTSAGTPFGPPLELENFTGTDRQRAESFNKFREEGIGYLGVSADHIRQDVRVLGVALGPGHAMAFSVAGRLQRIDGMNLIAGRDQRLHPRAAFGFDPDYHRRLLLVLAEVFSDHGVQPGDSRYPFGQFRSAQHPPGLVLHLHVVVLLGPVISQEQQHLSLLTIQNGHCTPAACRRRGQRPNKQVLTPESAGTTSHQWSGLPAYRQGHDLPRGLNRPESESTHPPAAYRTRV